MARSYIQIPQRRTTTLLVITTIIFIIIFYRFYNIQVSQFDKNTGRARANSIREINISAPRGIIYDRNGIPLVDNRPTFDLKVIPIDVTENFDFGLLAKSVNIPKNELQKKILTGKKTIARFRPLLLKRHVDFETMSKLEENRINLPGLLFSRLPARIYPNDVRMTHALGYLRSVTEEIISKSDKHLNYQLDDVYGAAGLEKIYELRLRGRNGVEYHLVDSYGRDRGITSYDESQLAISGDEMFLTIDSRLQLLAENLLSGKKGAIICSNPYNGDILSFVSMPDYNLSSFVGPIPIELWDEWNSNPEKPLMNRILNGTYPPGSSFKLLSAIYALESSRISSNWKVNCNGAYRFGNRYYHCWNPAGHGSINLKEAIKYSCNIYFYQLIQQIPFEDWAAIVKKFGFGEKTNIDLPAEAVGIVPTKEYMDKKYTSRGWAFGNLLSFVIGQGDVLVTPIQMVQMINLIATNGRTYSPHLSKDCLKSSITLDYKQSTWKFIQDAMYDVVNGEKGTGKNARITENGIVRGKTGTAQNPHGEDHSWFTGYVEAENGKMMSLAVLVENGGKGSEAAAPIAKELFKLFAEIQNNNENNVQ
ncbi:MAG: penicillin-binding protein 2 [Candidatus Marinimicrobia bacterium]|nr:penicillin-binding protein 2 [Candidatus Neomarinimicrobiota bacterium]